MIFWNVSINVFIVIQQPRYGLYVLCGAPYICNQRTQRLYMILCNCYLINYFMHCTGQQLVLICFGARWPKIQEFHLNYFSLFFAQQKKEKKKKQKVLLNNWSKSQGFILVASKGVHTAFIFGKESQSDVILLCHLP